MTVWLFISLCAFFYLLLLFCLKMYFPLQHLSRGKHHLANFCNVAILLKHSRHWSHFLLNLQLACFFSFFLSLELTFKCKLFCFWSVWQWM